MQADRAHRIRLIILVPLSLVMILFLAGALGILHGRTEQHINRENEQRLAKMDDTFEQVIDREGRILGDFLELIASQQDYRRDFLARDRDALQSVVQPLFERLRAGSQINHFSFIEPDRSCFLRAHDPETHGDRIDRITLGRAVDGGQTAQGVEIGSMGSLTLRVVRPWIHDGEVLGYLELGKELQRITPRVRASLDLDMGILVQKRFVEKESWQAGQAVFGYEGTWDRFHDFVIVDGNLRDFHAEMVDYLRHAVVQGGSGHGFRLIEHGVWHLGGSVPLRDVSGTRVGLLVGCWDATELVHEQRTMMVYVGVGILAGSALLLLFLGMYLGKVEHRLEHANRALQETITRQRADAEALIKNDRKLQREMKQRERAESDLKRQVQNLAEARAAALNMMEDTDEARRGAERVNRELAHAMAETERLRQEAVKSSQAKSEFLANMSHEIRTPMNGVLGMTDLLSTTDMDTQQREYLKVITTSGYSLLEIINDILDFSKIEAGMLDLEQVEFSVWDLVEDVCDTMAMTAQNKGLELVVRVRPDVPGVVKGDPGRLRQILVNLIGNAVKFTQEGEIVVTLEQDRNVDGGPALRFSVRDSGIGIPPDREASLFDAFSQADNSTTRRFGGTGLGLSISRRLVKLMDGDISLKSELGRGSEFWFTVALQPVAADQSVLPPASAAGRLGRVLVAVENQSLAEWLVVCLQPYAGELAQADSGQTVRELTGNGPWGLILVDEDLDGAVVDQVSEHLAARSDAVGSRAILLGPVVASCDRQRLMETGFDGHLNKPVRIRSLLQLVLTGTSDGSADAAPVADVVPESTVAGASSTSLPDSSRVLLVDDNLVNRKVGQGMLKKLGCEVVSAVNGADAVRILGHERFDVVLMDVQMPELDGYAATLQIRDPESAVMDHEVVVVAMTANAMEGDRDKCLLAGMDDYLAKPVTLDKLQSVLASALVAGPRRRPDFSELRHPCQSIRNVPVGR